MDDRRAIKRPRLDASSAASSTTTEKFRGVLPQQNGNWGAQIYTNHNRIWLGTFRSEKDAAMAYDSAAMKLRRGDDHSQRNFPWTHQNLHELTFQNAFSVDETLDMIRNGTYRTKFETFLKTHNGTTTDNVFRLSVGQVGCRELFRKELTPSDVGKLNRLVIPKKYAVRYFPCIDNGRTVDSDDTELVFYDRVMKTWKFRYCYWKSSQSFVFTRGWNKFVKEKELRANDVVSFYSCENGSDETRVCLIDVNYSASEGKVGISGNEESTSCEEKEKVELRLSLGATCSVGGVRVEEEEEEVAEKLKDGHGRVRLFGVQIN